MKTEHIEPEFVDTFPDVLERDVLYVSMKYATTAHLCASGCGNKVVLPLSPAEWRMCFDGEAVSLTPSVGNWEYPCQAHYWIRGNKIHWAAKWTKDQIEGGRANDQRDLDLQFNTAGEKLSDAEIPSPRKSVWTRLVRRLLRR